MDRKTVQIYEADKQEIDRIAEEQGVIHADVFAEAMEEYTGTQHHHRCPDCDGHFSLEDVDTSTVREKGIITSDMRYLLRGRSEVKDFECPQCEARIRPDDAEMASPVSTDEVSQEEA